MPVKPGDECMIHFTERSLDGWIKFGDIRGPNDIRMHHVSDAYFIPCTTSEPQATTNYDPDNMVIRNTDNTLKLVFDTSGNLTMEAVATITMKAPDIILDGDLQVTGKSQFDDNIDITGTSTATVDHVSGPLSIGGTTHKHPTAPTGPVSAPIP
jgi:hypothetical protein